MAAAVAFLTELDFIQDAQGVGGDHALGVRHG